MGNPTEQWYGIVRKMISLTKYYKSTESMQFTLIDKAIAETNKELLKNNVNGQLIIRAVDLILIKQTKNYEGAAMELHYDSKVIRMWISKYVYEVGKRAGYPCYKIDKRRGIRKNE